MRKGNALFAALARSLCRVVRHGGFGLSLGMLIASAVFWWRSDRIYEQVFRVTENNGIFIESRQGAVIVVTDNHDEPKPHLVQPWQYRNQYNYRHYWKCSTRIEEDYCQWGKIQIDNSRRVLGLHVAGGLDYTFVLRIPYWAPLTLFALATWLLLPKALSLRAFRRRRWARTGRCHQCGYDLRASSGICPECGRPIDPVTKRNPDISTHSTGT